MSKKLVTFLIVGGILLFLFTLFSYIVDKELLRQIDFDTTVKLQNLLPRRVDELFSVFSILGSFEVLLIVVASTLIFLRRIIAGFIAFSAFVFFHIVEIFGKTVVEQLPPPQFMLRTDKLLDFPQFHVRLEYSYPSGHSGRTAFFAVLVLFFILRSKFPLWLKVVLSACVLGFTVLMLVSRIYLGEHWASDVLGGVMLGGALSLLSLGFYQLRFKKKFL